MIQGGRYFALRSLALGLAVAGYIIRPEAAEGRCDLGFFQGEWTTTGDRDDHIIVTRGDITVKAGSATTRLVLRPEQDLGERSLAEVEADMRQVASIYPAVLAQLGSGTTRLCQLRVVTPGGRLVLLVADGGLLWLEEAQADPPGVQRLQRPGKPPDAHPVQDHNQPPR